MGLSFVRDGAGTAAVARAVEFWESSYREHAHERFGAVARARRRAFGRPAAAALLAHVADATPLPGAGRAVLVTGAAGGIGGAIAARLERDGWRVHGVDVDDADLATPEGNGAVVAAAQARFGRLDAVVAAAGFQHVAPVRTFPLDRWEALLAIHLTSPFLLARHAWDSLAASGDGRFCVIGSAHSLAASPFKAGYVAAKHGVLGLVKTIALEGAPVGISASAICPGYVRTPLVEAQVADQAAAHDLPEERVLEEVILAPHAVKRLLEPDEVADVAAFVLGPSGRAFTGSPVVIDLGWTAA